MWFILLAASATFEVGEADRAKDIFRSSVAPPPAWTAFYAEFTPISMAASRPTSGPGRLIGTWTVSVCNPTSQKIVIPRAIVLARSPFVRWIPDGQRDAILSYQNNRSGWRVLGRILRSYGPIIAVGISYSVSGARSAAISGVGGTLLSEGLSQLQKTADERAPTYRLFNPLPPEVAVPSEGCVEHDFLSGIISEAKKH